uniref:Uncharacterized protein n=1 Tax=Moniliophthora roreri TaxID=221103 RepID=A0A0W0FN42_MONRR
MPSSTSGSNQISHWLSSSRDGVDGRDEIGNTFMFWFNIRIRSGFGINKGIVGIGFSGHTRGDESQLTRDGQRYLLLSVCCLSQEERTYSGWDIWKELRDLQKVAWTSEGDMGK